MANQNIGKLYTPLGPDSLLLTELYGREALSELFQFDIEALSDLEDIDFDKLLGKGAHVELDLGRYGKRLLHGVVTEGCWIGMTEFHKHRYRLTLRPWLWLLGKTTDCRIYHEKTVVQIVSELFSRRGFAVVEWRVNGNYPTLHYTVQYRETDLNFVSRLLEQHGITYFFEHSDSEHKLVLADGPSSHRPAPGLAELGLGFHPNVRAPHLSVVLPPHVHAWESSRALRSGRVELNDYNHLKPNQMMRAEAQAARRHQHGALEIYDHPGIYSEKTEGDTYAKLRLEAEQAQDGWRHGEGLALALYPGATVKLARHPRGAENRDWLVTEIVHGFSAQTYRSGDMAVDVAPYQAKYRFIDAKQPFRPLLLTEKPLVHSLQTALVTGAEGEEIDCDSHGRILVKFYWDRHGDKSCRLRVSQVWGAKTWGGQIIPRIGMEVMVAYIDGDPDRPIVVGTVPDPQNNRVPYKLPENKTRMVWRSNTHKGSGYNELSFEDEAGRENLLLHAQKDLTQKVLNNHTSRIDNSLAQSVGSHLSTEVGGNANHEIGGSQNQVIGAVGPAVMGALGSLSGVMGQTAGVAGEALDRAGGMGPLQGLALGLVGQAAQALLSGSGLGGRGGVVGGGSPRADMGTALANAGTQMLSGVGQLFEGMGGTQNTLVTSMKTDTIGQLRTETVGVSKVTNVGKTFYTKVGDKYKIEAGEELEIVVGQAQIVMRKDGSIIINGTKFVWTATGPVEIYGRVIDMNKK